MLKLHVTASVAKVLIARTLVFTFISVLNMIFILL